MDRAPLQKFFVITAKIVPQEFSYVMADPIHYAEKKGRLPSVILDVQWTTWELRKELKINSPRAFLCLRVVFPPVAREATKAEIPRKWGKITEKLQKLYFGVLKFTPLLGQFSPIAGVGPGRGIFVMFFPHFFRGFPRRWLPGPSKGKNNSAFLCL